jgi:two-component system, NtrC family, C4-dicarboxylate transport response regulator DctD
MTKLRVLLIDDEPDVRAATAQSLDLAGFAVQDISSPERAIELISFGFSGIVLTDIRMPAMDGLTLMTRVHDIDRDIPVILLTGHGDVQLAVRAMREGAHDFIEKPFESDKLAKVIERALEYRRLVLENRILKAAAGQRDDLEQRLLGRSAAMVDLRRRIRTIGPSDADVLIVGETGAGKEVTARALHDTSPRAQRPFITIDCAALPAALMESELFGHEAGAFVGAHRARFGKFEHARGGTVLLDDIASLPLEMQGKLLRVIETRAITRLGSHDAVPLDLRFLATTRLPLEAEVRAGRFRSDLLYRLNVVTLHVPPLAARRDDIALLFLRLLAEAARRHDTDPAPPSAALIAQITSSDWPGNVRELRNAADRYALGIVETKSNTSQGQDRLATRVANFERREIEAALAAHGGHLRKVYESLGVSRKTLYEKMQKHGLERDLLSGEAVDD